MQLQRKSTGLRVWCLYRVSTKKQVEENDIPMQRKECQAFCRKNGWELTKELQEQGVSGYSVYLEDREVIREIKNGAANKEFDIFLVYMFDRVGRKEFEVPAFLRYLVENGIQVWSTQEGEQRFDNDSDSFLAMIRSFTAQRESVKLATRIRTKHMQMALSGQYRGGKIPFGYKTRDSTHINRKGEPVQELTINEVEAAIVRLIFNMRVNEKLGTHIIASRLCEMKLPGDNHNWRSSSVSALLSNRIYIGQMKYGSELSMPFEHLRIVSNDMFLQAQAMRRKGRKGKRTGIPQIQIQYYDILFCAHCGGHLIYDVVRKQTTPNGKINEREVFRCYNKLRYADPCNGQSTYGKRRLDRLVKKHLRETLTILMEADPEMLIDVATERSYCMKRDRIEALETELKEMKEKIAYLKAELFSATKIYGIEATTNLQIIITEQMNNMSVVRDTLRKEKQRILPREAIKEKMEMELDNAKKVFLDFDVIPEQELLEYCTTVYEQIRVKKGYEVSIVLSPLLKLFIS